MFFFSHQEFDEVRESIKSSLSEVMRSHSVFSTSAIPRRCFASKAKANDYHSSTKGIPVSIKNFIKSTNN